MRFGPRRRVVTASILLLYAVSVAAVTVVPVRMRPPDARPGLPWWIVVHWVPFRVEAWSFLLNVVMFVPLGLLVPLLWPAAGSLRRIAAVSLACSAAIETLQLVWWLTLGSFRTVDVNDLIANTAGGVAGVLLLRAVVRRDRAGRAAVTTRSTP
ncbi:VanZ family protein [Couchioplanes caeruleus]|uniref:VanZ family protein n=1 Tax=Couchioplanes caeruleus TaxID=56438 RepID=UPI0020BF402B|nr:VanZ family protein [Couchioplanes caeruleus]UQU62886.1 VanZ family protein [Couchioplanes caeruleus]